MPKGTIPDSDQSARPADLEQAGAWLAQHGLADVQPTPLLATRLAARRRTRLTGDVLLAAFIIAVALIYTIDLSVDTSVDGTGTYRHWSLLALTVVVATLVLAQSLLDRRVRRADRRAGTTLPRRAAHPIPLGWRTVLGRPRAAFATATFMGAALLAIATLATQDSTARYPALVLLIALGGVAVGMIVQLRHVLTHPTVADDEVSLTADVIMRIEDARNVATPTAVWCLPVVSVFATALGWWITAWFAFIALSALTHSLITLRTASSETVARHVTGGR
ncbi:hypothetical protein [Streptomyces muensis]|uniref:Uncharacterized protein n=1 Tax=Streptomyces muensis TaxID=1077944 RepID=A0A9X1Q7K9_STRM4|nr:hypothetical protein [Streptomyces muensis]MCF1599390.1 hypothetical protein [Streptomyces muensis]